MKKKTGADTSIVTCLLTVAAVLIFSACNSIHNNESTSDSSSTQVSAASLNGFSTTVYAFGQTQGCVQCHAAQVNPQWMNNDVTAAYQFARPLVDFSNPTASIFATYVSNNHCNNPICAVASNSSVMQSLLTQWAQIEVQQGSSTSIPVGGSSLANPSFVTQAIAIPTPLPLITTSQVSVVRFDLSLLTPAVAPLSGATLELSIQSFNAGQNEYKIFNPRIYGNPGTVDMTGVHIYVRPSSGSGLGTEDVVEGLGWSSLNVDVVPQAAPSPLPTGPATTVAPLTPSVLGVQAQSASDVITIGFANIQ